MVVVESAGITDVGKKRVKNEDAILIDKNLNLFVVADGMGGHLA
jgi:serine/threonine protein phosphatase PrpC